MSSWKGQRQTCRPPEEGAGFKFSDSASSRNLDKQHPQPERSALSFSHSFSSS